VAVTIDQLISILKAGEVRYLIVPDQPAVALGMTTDTGRHFLIHATIEAQGSLMQFRTTGYAYCPLSGPHLEAVMRLLNDMNFHLRMVKFTLDPADGEIVVFTDLAVLDSEVTATQILGTIGFVMERLSECAVRVETTIKTGVDPGEDELIGQEEPAPTEPTQDGDDGGDDDVID
jgi:hypothetical protein